MTHKNLLAILVLVSAPSMAAADEPVQTPDITFESAISADDVRPHLEFLASEDLAGRRGRDGLRASQYIAKHFESIGLEPGFRDKSWFQLIPGTVDENGNKPIVGRNVAGCLVGSDPKLKDEYIIVSAHFDHLGVRDGKMFRGADDNASGTSMLLAVSKYFAAQKKRPKRSLLFVGFDLEEHMLWGSRWFAAQPPCNIEQIKFFMTADMIGRSLGNLPLDSVFVLGSEHAPRLKTVLDEVGRPKGLAIARMGIDLIGTRSDYGPFRDRKIPFLFFSTGEHPDYHTPNDLPERIEYDKVARVSGLVLRIAENVANGDTAPTWSDAPDTSIEEVRALNEIAAKLLTAEGEHQLNSVQRFMVSQTKNRTSQIVERGVVTSGERQWLIRAAQLMLLSIF